MSEDAKSIVEQFAARAKEKAAAPQQSNEEEVRRRFYERFAPLCKFIEDLDATLDKDTQGYLNLVEEYISGNEFGGAIRLRARKPVTIRFRSIGEKIAFEDDGNGRDEGVKGVYAYDGVQEAFLAIANRIEKAL